MALEIENDMRKIVLICVIFILPVICFTLEILSSKISESIGNVLPIQILSAILRLIEVRNVSPKMPSLETFFIPSKINIGRKTATDVERTTKVRNLDEFHENDAIGILYTCFSKLSTENLGNLEGNAQTFSMHFGVHNFIKTMTD